MTRQSLAVLAAAAVLSAAAPACAQTSAPSGGAAVTLPSNPVGQRAAALLATVAAGDEATVRRFFDEQVDPSFRDQSPMEEHLAIFGRMHHDLGAARVERYRETGDGRALLRVTQPASGQAFEVEVEVSPRAPHRIVGIGVRPEGTGNGEGPPPSPEMSAAARRAAVDSVAALVERRYVHPDTGRMIAARLRERQAAGAYDRLSAFPQLADTLTRDLRSVNGDRHLNVRFGRPRGGARRAGPGGGAEGGDFGITAARLEGNVGHLKLAVVPGGEQAIEAMTNALRTLGGTDAVIVDLRGTPGGSAEMANFLISHFTAPGIVSLGVFTPGARDTTWRATLAQVPGPRRAEVPLYVLVDGGSASAAEDIPFVLQNLGRATIVGETTAGAGRNNEILPVGNGLSVSISRTVVFDPRTRREWERVGITPDVAAPSARALDTAHAAGLRAVLARGGDAARRAEVERALAAVEARLGAGGR